MPWKRALVTGASSGIGDALARQLAAGGSDLMLVARRADRLEELASGLRSEHGVAVDVLPADLTDPEQLATVEARVADPADPIDLLVNNAGYAVAGGVGFNDIEREVASVTLNAIVPLRLMHAAIPGMKARGRGWILNVSSLGAFQPGPGLSTYTATKAFLNNLTEGVHEELRRSDVTATVVCPGFTRTEFQAVAGEATASSNVPELLWQSADEVAAEALDAVARGRAVHVTGVHNRLVRGVTHLMPGGVIRRVVGAATRSM